MSLTATSLPSRGLVAAILAATATVASLLALSSVGLFHKIVFQVKPLPKGSKYLVKNHRGEYKDAKKYAKDLPSSTHTSVAIYWDDPRIMEKRCRFSVGVPITYDNQNAGDELAKQGGWIPVEAENDMETLHCTFPYTGTISAIVAAIRVYPLWVEEAKRLGKGHGPIVKISPSRVGENIEFYFLTMPPPTSSSFTNCMSMA